MNRTLRRPMFRMGGSTEGITSGLSRQGYATNEDNLVKQNDTSKMSIMDRLNFQKSMVETLAPRAPRTDRSMSNFLIDFGLDIASRPPSGSIFSTAASAAKEPFSRFQESKRLQEAYGMSETSEDRALIADMIKGMDDDKLSALMRDVKAGVESGLFPDEATGIKLLLQKKIYGVLDMPGEAENTRIRELEVMIARDQEVPTGMVKAVATHIYKMETNAYPEDIQKDLNRTKTYIKPNHIAGVKKDDDGDTIEIVIDQVYDKTYTFGQIYFDAQTGDLFKRTSKEGEAIIFTKVILE
jgi:hypothetical protein